jgi:tetratricopeptide (TPR) repeat protein
MTSKHASITDMGHGALLSSLLASLVILVVSGCGDSTSSGTSIDTGARIPTAQTERELLLDIERRFENPQAHYELARLYHSTHEWAKAEYQYNIALGFQPGLLAAQVGLVKLYTDEKETAKAAHYADSYINQVRRNTRDTLKLAWEFDNIGLDDYAMRCFRQALSEAPESPDANKQMGLYYLGKGDMDNARQYLGRSFELNPNQADVAGALGRLGVVVQSPQPQPEEETRR